MSAPRLSVGKGMNRRTTKAGARVQEHFMALVAAHLESIGAKRVEDHYCPAWDVRTRYGALRVTPMEDWVACRFLDWPKDYASCISYARANGFEHWKWNHHYHEGAAEPEVEDFARRLAAIL